MNRINFGSRAKIRRGCRPAFNAESYSNEACDVTWDVTETEAASAVPEGLEVTDVRKVSVRTV